MAQRKQAVTIKHVARDAGVSLQTVSRVMNNVPNVSPEMKQRVQASIDRLGYVPSIAAQRMGGSRSYIILAINDRERTIADWQLRQGTDWVDQMLLGGMTKCAEHGYRMLIELVDTHNDHVERELGAALTALQPDGVIITPPHSDNPQILALLQARAIPFARIGSTGSDGLGGIALTMDDEGSARLAVRHLAGLGHRLIGFIAGPADYQLSGWRVEGWRAEMALHGLDAADSLLETGDFTFEGGERAARALLAREPRPTAIIASNDQMAFATLEVASALGLDVPGDLSLVSFDNTPMARFTRPSLTAIDQPVAETAARAVDLLIGQQRGDDGDPVPMPINVSGSLVVRGSTAAAKS
eukprot:gene16931-17118_t